MLILEQIKTINTYRESGPLDNNIYHVKVDNRKLDKDSLFIAIVGQRFNPLEHLEAVVERDCKHIVCELKYKDSVAAFNDRLNFIFVNEIEQAIQEIGTLVATQFRAKGGKIIAISGSNGKTTTKEMLFHLLDSVCPNKIICTQKNNNNHLGVPFTLFQINNETEYAIVELGSNHPGEIENLCHIIEPQFGVTTNIGATHLEFFKTLDAVFKEESSVVNFCETFFKNVDDPFLSDLSGKSTMLSYGEFGTDFKFAFLDRGLKVNEVELQNSHLTGKHNFINLGLAFIMAQRVLSIESSGLKKYAESFKPTPNRSQWISAGSCKVFLDAYNANPSSMGYAIEGFVQASDSSSSVALVLGDMNELGAKAAEYHKEIGELLNKFDLSQVFFIGRFAGDYTAGYSGSSESFDSVQELLKKRVTLLNDYDYLFIKGSRSLQLETILDI